MALDFGLLNTNAPAQIAGAYGRGQQEAQANQLAQLQMRQQTASTQGAEMNLTRLQQEHDALDKLMTEITANGGPSDPMQAADMMIKSKIPEYFKRGLEMKQSYAQLNNDRVAMGLPPLSSAAAPAPAVSSNRVNEPNAAPGVEIFKVNEQPAPVNALAAQTQTQAPDKNALMMQAKAKLLSPNVGVREAGKLEMQQLLSPKDTTAPDAKLMQQLGYPLTQAGYQAFRDAQRADRLLTPAELQQKLAIAAAGRAPGTSVTMVAEKAEAGAFGKMMVDQFADLSKSANLAVKSLPSIEANLNILNKGLDTGFGTETKAAGARVLSALGVKDAEKYATDTQTFQSNAIQGLLQKQLEQKGPQTESDAQRLEQIGAQLGKTKKANEFILDTAREQLKRDIEQRNFYAKWKEKTDSFKGAEDAWFNGEGGKSLFDRPALKKYLTPTIGAVSQIPTTAAPVRSTPVAPNIDALLNKYK
jgi:hypothetical protein